ncbi:DHH family phosphoesterase [Clostridium sp. UBA6640]|uniref:DHH family phosphoesterase n=1 Tax=Clostridium sp. UBA6640 TaxID=1946370 RepID=UPI0025BF3B10|nr:bifunctional oligoribonuclease/PAP phosphatase NrnA [Clostridium sp. UBA6640]
MTINNVIEKIKESKKIAITFHTSPDGDSLGSSTALALALRSIGKDCTILCKEAIPQTFTYLPCSEEITGENYNVEQDTDLVIVLDCGDFKRINAEILLKDRNYTLINVDHHMSNELYGDVNYVNTNAAAVGEIIYEILKLLDISLTKEIGVALYTSLLTDTGSFRHSNTTSDTHNIAGDIINTGIDFSEIHRIIFDNKSFNKVKLYGKVIETMTLECNKKVVFMELANKMLEELNLDGSDTSDLIAFGSKVESAEVTVMIKESEDGVKVSLRSKNKVDVRKVAEGFNGGGHIRAAGFVAESNIQTIKEKLITILEKELI